MGPTVVVYIRWVIQKQAQHQFEYLQRITQKSSSDM